MTTTETTAPAYTPSTPGFVTTSEGFQQQPAGRRADGVVTVWPLWGGAYIASATEAATFVAR